MDLHYLCTGSPQPVGHSYGRGWRSRSVILTLALLLAAVIAPAQESSEAALEGQGTKDSPYLIKTLDDYNAFAQKVNGGQPGACAKLENDISGVTVMVGTDQNRYAGTFDGDCHRLTVDITGKEQFTAPFCRVQNATIQNLYVSGKVRQTGSGDKMYHASGLSGWTNGATFSRVISDVAITFDHNGDAHSGGLVGHAANSTVNISDCAFTGSATEPVGNNSSFGGLIGWCDRGGKFNVSNSYVDLSLTNITGLNNFVRAQDFQPNNSTFKNCFYVLPSGTQDWDPEPNTIKVSADQMKGGYVANMLQNAHNDGMVWGQSINGDNADLRPMLTTDAQKHVYKVAYTYNNKDIWAGYGNSGDEISLPGDYAAGGVTLPVYLKPASTAPLAVTIGKADTTLSMNDNLVLVLPKSNRYTVTAKLGEQEIADSSIINGEGDLVFSIAAKDGFHLFSEAAVTMKKSGTADYAAFTEPSTLAQDGNGIYHLSTTADWDTFAKYCTTGDYVMDNDIKTVTSMAGNAAAFAGTFDGKGHTLDVNITVDDKTNGAPFRNAKGATFRNLRVTGAVNSMGSQFAAGLVSNVNDNVAITVSGCEIAVNITSSRNGDGTHGGIVAVNAAAHITNSLFSGSINGANTGSCGGFLGWVKKPADTYITNCLNMGSFNLKADGGAATFIRGDAYPINHSYYKNQYGAAQGDKAADEQLASGALAWELQHYAETTLKDTADVAWGQVLGGDSANAFPVPTIDKAKRVYRAQFLVDGKVVFTSYANPGKQFTLPKESDLGVTSITIPAMAPAEKDTNIVITAQNSFNVPRGEHFTVKVKRNGTELKDNDAVSMTDDLTYTVTANNGYRLITDSTFTLKGNEPFPAPALLPVDEKGFVQIATRDDWNKLAANYNGSRNDYMLTADIDSITTMVGSEAKPFTGTFDGQGHTLTLDYDLASKSDAEQFVVGPFRYASNATITNLRTAGKVNTRKTTNDMGGIIGRITIAAGAATTLTNCESYVDNTFNAPNDATNGGLIGRLTSNASVTIENCAFKGKVTATNGGNSFGGLIGYVDDNATAAYIKNCLVAATFNVNKANSAEYGNAPFARRKNSTQGKVHVTNSYYLTQPAFEVFSGQGTAETQDSIARGAVAHHLQATQENPGKMVWGQRLTGDSIDALPVLTTTDSMRVYQAKFSDKHSDKAYYTYANTGKVFPEPTPAELGVGTVATTYDKKPAEGDILAELDAYNSKLQLSIPTGTGYVVTVTRDGKQLEDKAELYDTDVLVYHISAAKGYKLLSASEVTLKPTEEFTAPDMLTTDKDDYALIKSADDWNMFAKNCTGGNYRLTADIKADSIVGTKNKPFTGIFDGQRHTLTVDYDMKGIEDVAPFSIIKNATIKNLTVRGNIQTNMPAGDAAGLVGEANGTVRIENVQVGALLYWAKTTASADMTSAGIVGRVNDNCNITMDNCLFNGSIIGEQGCSVAGFIGWAHGSNVSINISNSLVSGSFNVQKANNGAGNETFARRDSRAKLTITNSYYNPFSAQEYNDQGTAVSDSLLETGTVAYLLQCNQDSLVWGQNIDLRPSWGDTKPLLSNDAAKRVYRAAYAYNGAVIYSAYGNTDDQADLPGMDNEEFNNLRLPSYLAATGLKDSTITFKDSDVTISLDGHLKLQLPESECYTVSATMGENTMESGDILTGEGNLVFHIAANDGYKLFTASEQVMKAGNGNFATFNKPKVLAVASDGYYLLSTKDDWDFLAANNPDGNYRLTADIDSITTMVGSQAKPFKGTFDGQGHKLTVNYDLRGQKWVAPFRFANGATFKDLHISGTILSNDQFTSGFVGEIVSKGSPVTFTNCHSSVDMQWQGGTDADMTWGGFVGVSRSGASFNNCVFDGKLGDYQTNHNEKDRAFDTGGFLGWTDVDVTVKNCLMAAEIMGTTWSYTTSYVNATFGRSPNNGNRVKVENSYYLFDRITRSTENADRYYWQGTPLTSANPKVKGGELAYTLQGNDSVQHWGQAIGTDPWPVLTSDSAKHVFRNVYDGEETAAYANTITFDETKGNKANIAAHANAKGSVKLSRTFSEGWNTLVLPVDLSTEDVIEAFGEGTKVAYFTNNTANTIELNTNESTKAIKANVPVLIMPGDTTATEFTFTGKTIEKADSVVASGDMHISMIGSYNASLTVPANDYFISGKYLWKSLGNTTISATRAYFHAPELFKGKLRLVIDGEDVTTGIDGVKSPEAGTTGSAVYTLSGQKVADSLDAARKANLPTGVYIVNGKKTVIK